MPHRHGLRPFLFGVVVVVTGACEKDKLSGPEAEVTKSTVKMSLPAVPSFDLPPANPDGSHSVKELRVKGKKLLDTDVVVKGYVTWAYDCATALREPGMDEKAVQKIIDDDPTKCERPKFYVGDAPDTPAEKSLWVVDVPRPYNVLEMKRLKPKERNQPDRCEPNEKDPKKQVCPPYKVGDQVEVTGKFALASPHSERNSEGLVVYKKMKNVTTPYESPEPPPTANGQPGQPGQQPTGPGQPPAKPSPEDIVKQKGKKAG